MNTQNQQTPRPMLPERDQLLTLARQQSQRRVDEQLAFEPPFDWSRVERAPRRRLLGVPRLALAGLMILVLGSVTWAFVLKRREAPRSAISSEMLQRQVGDAGPAPLKSLRKAKRAHVPKAVVQRDVPAKRARKQTKASVTPPTKVAKQTPKASTGPKLRPTDADGKVSFGDEVILVRPPAKMKPLWTPEQYKKRFGPGFNGGRLGPRFPKKGDETLP
jgi:hypothetical protein